MPPANPANPVKAITDKLVRQAKADPKKASVLAVLVAVLAFMWFRALSGTGGGPASASAMFAGEGSGGSAGGYAVPDNLRLPSQVSPAQAALQEWARRPIAPLSRNLFVINYDFFPQEGARVEPVVRAAPGDGFWDQLAKSMAARADQIKEHQVLLENLRRQVGQLKVQSTLMGASPKALVNGQLVGVGDVVASFRVTKIEARRIVVEREGIKFALRFN
ncbi:MAG TPA: hypothetical protein VH475_02445 [Tepidisphaeraceae bacterium]|jgi:hypothetical protein